ncbi:hypothetical protein HXX76_009810 [Chlamydomonas incerta]|uniref:Uncharacterized protein n=1 Tax=Chlamydomonas incerta TaxID=51695 RepID=A0A835T3C6_CHLIN|nr:hypothetical protein HXX76_009810 [Chlamydomonas incerta]|eukprot:KAG2430836.1 hypothetical protein HXX76_009810 [Chlamydomonas incerta]
MGLITGTLLVIAAVVTSPLWIPFLATAVFAPHVLLFVMGALAVLTSPLWIPALIVGLPLLLITSPIWGTLLLLAIIF